MQKKGAIEMDQIIKDKFEIEEQLEMIKRSSSMEVERMRTTIEQREQEIDNKKRELFELK